MRAVSYQLSSDPDRVSLRRRATGFTLALIVHILLGLMLLSLASMPPNALREKVAPLIVQLLPEPKPEPAAARSPKVERPKPPPGKATPRPPTPPPEQPVPPLEMIQMTREQFAAADISRIPTHSREAPSGTGTAGRGAGSDDGGGAGAGDGPGGEQLYNADWFRRPTSAELAFYLPRNGPHTGWGMIACQTVAGNRVENCQEIGQSPSGSGLASAVRQAAWQFRVLPPRIGGRPMIGAWVRIRIDYTERGAAAR